MNNKTFLDLIISIANDLKKIEEEKEFSLVKDITFERDGDYWNTTVFWITGEETRTRMEAKGFCRQFAIAICFMDYFISIIDWTTDTTKSIMERYAKVKEEPKEEKKETKEVKIDIPEEEVKATDKNPEKHKKDPELLKKRLESRKKSNEIAINNNMTRIRAAGWKEEFIEKNNIEDIVKKLVKNGLVVVPSTNAPYHFFCRFKSEIKNRDGHIDIVKYYPSTGSIVCKGRTLSKTFYNKKGIDDLIDILTDPDYKKYLEI